jgi:hypothetical protein
MGREAWYVDNTDCTQDQLEITVGSDVVMGASTGSYAGQVPGHAMGARTFIAPLSGSGTFEFKRLPSDEFQTPILDEVSVSA